MDALLLLVTASISAIATCRTTEPDQNKAWVTRKRSFFSETVEQPVTTCFPQRLRTTAFGYVR